MRSGKITAEMLKFVYQDFDWCIAYNGKCFFVTYQDDFEPPAGPFVNHPSVVKILTTRDIVLVDPLGNPHWWHLEDDYFEDLANSFDCPEWNKEWQILLEKKSKN